MPPEKTDYDPDEAAGLVGEIPPLKPIFLPHEAAYLSRLVSADIQRMTENRDHGVSHGMRGYAPPDLETATLVLHSLDMARTAAAIEAIESLEDQRADLGPGGTDTETHDGLPKAPV